MSELIPSLFPGVYSVSGLAILAEGTDIKIIRGNGGSHYDRRELGRRRSGEQHLGPQAEGYLQKRESTEKVEAEFDPISGFHG